MQRPTNNIRNTLQDVERVHISTYNQQLMQDQKLSHLHKLFSGNEHNWNFEQCYKILKKNVFVL